VSENNDTLAGNQRRKPTRQAGVYSYALTQLGEVENEYSSHNFILASLLAILVPEIIKVGGHLMKF